MQLNEKYWHNPTQFLPERWIPGEPAHDELNQFDASMPFSKG
jgi:cytochrome P450